MFPVQDPIWICVIALVLILFIPMLCRRLRFPQIAGLILAGVILGPGLLNVLDRTPVLDFFSQIGLLFIMFFAGLQIDLEEMKRNKFWGILFGLLTFGVPWILCFICGHNLLGMSVTSASIMGCIMGSHTLVSYPIINRYGLARRKSVTISVAGALIAILLALIIYTIRLSAIESDSFNTLLFIAKVTVYVAVIIIFYPRMARHFFNAVTNSFSHFLFVMILLALSCGLAGLVGLDAIIGAFLAGIVINRYVPKSSPLMNRLDFVGNTLFIPTFLLNTGLMIDIKGLTGDWGVLAIFIVLTAAGTIAKWFPAFIVQKAGRLQSDDRKLIFGLSESHAAGALAIAMGAFSAGMLGTDTLSATVLIVLVSCIISNIITEKGASSLHQKELMETGPMVENRLLVTLTGSNTLQALMDTAMILRRPTDREMVGLYVTINGEHAPKYLQDGKGRLTEAARIAASADIPFLTQNRLGNNIVDSIIHATNEFETRTLVMGMPLRPSITTQYYESIIQPLIDGIPGQIVMQRMNIPMNTVRRIIVLVPGPVLQDEAFEQCMKIIYDISVSIGCATEFYGKNQDIDAVRGTGFNYSSGRVSYNEVSETADMHNVMNSLHDDHLLMIVGPRDSESHAARSFRHLYERIHMLETNFSTMLLFPQSPELKGKEEATVRTGRDFLKMLRM